MYTSKLFAVLKTFEELEWKGCLNFLDLYGSSTKDTSRLYLYIYKYRKDLKHHKLESTITRNELFAHLGEKSFRNILSKLHRIVEDYLVWQRVTNNRSMYDLQLFEVLDDRGLDNQANKVADRIKDNIQKSDTTGFYQFYTLHKIAHEHYFSDNPIKYTKGKELLFDAYIYLQQYHCSLEKLYEIELHNMSKVMNQDWLTEFEALRKNRVPSNTEDTLTALNRVKTTQNPDEKDYRYLKNQLSETKHDRVMSMAIYIYLDQSLKRNYLREHRDTERFELMQGAIAKDLFMDKGTISAPRLWNCVNLACNLGELEWVENIIEEHQDKLAPNDKELLVLINATLAFHKGDYISCYRITATHSFSNPRWDIILRNLKLKCYIELGEKPSEISEEINNTRNFLENQKANLSNNLYVTSINHCSAITFMLSGDTENLSKIIDKDLVSHRLWLNEKLNKLTAHGPVGAYKPAIETGRL